MSIPQRSQEDLFGSLASILIPREYLKDFDVVNIEEKHMEWLIVLREKEDRIPRALSGKTAVLNGYCNPISIMSHAFSLKKVYLQFNRRRWKEAGKDADYSNAYDLHQSGMKTTKEFGAFLKEISR